MQQGHSVAEQGGEDAQKKSCVHFSGQGYMPDITAVSLEDSGEGSLQAALCCDNHSVKLCSKVSHLTAKHRKTVTPGTLILCGFISENGNILFSLGMPCPTDPVAM